MVDPFREAINQQGAAAQEIADRFGRVDHEIDVDLTQAELDLLNDRIESGGHLGRAARDLLDRAVEKAEAKEREEASSGAASKSESSEDQTGNAGAKGAGGLKKSVGDQVMDGVKAALRSESRT